MPDGEIASIQQVSAVDIPHQSVPMLLGAAYVMEGSTLGGQFIARTVSAALQLPQACGVLYFSSYGSRVGSMWKDFGEALRERLVSKTDRDTAIRSASSMFELMETWLTGVLA